MNENPQTQWVAVTRSYAARVKEKSLRKMRAMQKNAQVAKKPEMLPV